MAKGHPVLPPTYLGLALLLMIGLRLLWPGPPLIPSPFHYAGLVFMGLGLAINIWSSFRFEKLGTSMKPFEASTALETGGLFGRSRNPMYLGMVLGLLGLAILLRHSTPFFVIPVFIWWITRTYIRPEEAALEERFGEEYTRYKATVRRWM